MVIYTISVTKIQQKTNEMPAVKNTFFGSALNSLLYNAEDVLLTGEKKRYNYCKLPQKINEICAVKNTFEKKPSLRSVLNSLLYDAEDVYLVGK